MVPAELRYTKDHEWVRLDGDTATVGITQYAADQLGDIVFVELPDVGRVLEQFAAFGVVESVKAVSDLFAPLSGEILATNAGARREPGDRSTAIRTAMAGWSGCGSPTRPARPNSWMPQRTTTWSRPADRTMPYGPHTASDRERMLATLGLTSVDQLFDDIPVALRASALDLPPPEPELELAARLQALAADEPDGPRLVPRRRRLPPLDAAGRRSAPAAR